MKLTPRQINYLKQPLNRTTVGSAGSSLKKEFGCKTMRDVVALSYDDLKSTHGVGEKSFNKIVDEAGQHGFDMGTTIPESWLNEHNWGYIISN